MPNVKNIGKPCALVAHARFDEGGQARACSLLYPGMFVTPGMFDPGNVKPDLGNIHLRKKNPVDTCFSHCQTP